MSRSPSFLGRETWWLVVTRFSPGALCKHCGVSSSAAWEESLVYPVCVTVMTEWGAKNKKKKRMREIRCVSRTTVYNFCLSLSLPRLPPSCCRLPGIFQSCCLCVSLTRMASAVDCLFFYCVTLYLCLCLCLCLTRDDLEMRFRAQVHVPMYVYRG